jgi:hypothetical protein
MKIAIFYHVFQHGISAFVYQQQIHRLCASGLVKAADLIHIGVNGSNELFNIPDNARVVYNKNQKEETDTLYSLRDFCKENEDYKVLYFHLKGGSKQTLHHDSWRLMMEYFVIDRWKECVAALEEGYDCAGQTWEPLGDTVWSDGSRTSNEGVGFYPGNFWWANASYINTLDNKYLESGYRLDREFWIGSNKNHKAKSLNKWRDNYCIENNLDTYYFSEKEYIL